MKDSCNYQSCEPASTLNTGKSCVYNHFLLKIGVQLPCKLVTSYYITSVVSAENLHIEPQIVLFFCFSLTLQ